MMSNWEEIIKMSLCVDDIVYVENPREVTKNLLELIVSLASLQDTSSIYKI